jgi:transposase
LFQIKSKTLNFWYKEILSNHHRDVKDKKFAAQSIDEVDFSTGEVLKENIIHILKPGNVGAKMCIDEKMIGKRYCTILSNAETGKMALLMESMKPNLVRESLKRLGTEALEKVEQICSDMSPMYKKMCVEIFPKATLSVDKFHVIKQVLDVLQTLRIEAKSESKKESSQVKVGSYGWTKIELLEKSRYILYKKSEDLSDDERIVARLLFEHFPTIKKAYDLIEEFRNWYSKANKHHPRWYLEKTLGDWLVKVETCAIKQFKFIRKMVEKHENEIVNYFETGHTNAKAENLNAKIQRFIIGNYGLRNRDFFYYRLQVYFT